MKTLIFLVLMLFTLHGQDQAAPIEPTTVVEKNHYYSNEVPAHVYTIRNIKKGQSAVIVIRQKLSYKTSPNIFENNAQITLTTKDQNVTCLFKSYQNLCVMKDMK